MVWEHRMEDTEQDRPKQDNMDKEKLEIQLGRVVMKINNYLF